MEIHMDNNEKDMEIIEAEEPVMAEEPVEAAEAEAELPQMPERSAEDLAMKRKKEIWDKITTALLILVLSSPIMILAYILIWFLNRGA